MVQRGEAFEVTRGIRGVTSGVFRVSLLQRGEHVRDGVRGERGVEPEVRVRAAVVMVRVLAGQVDVRQLGDEIGFGNAREGFDDGGAGRAFAGFERFAEPVFHAVAVDDEELRAGEFPQIARSELVVVRADIGGKQIFNFREVARDIRGEAIDREKAGEDFQLAGRFCRRCGERKDEPADEHEHPQRAGGKRCHGADRSAAGCHLQIICSA